MIPWRQKKLKSLPLNYFGTLWGLDNAVYVCQNMNFCPVFWVIFMKFFFGLKMQNFVYKLGNIVHVHVKRSMTKKVNSCSVFFHPKNINLAKVNSSLIYKKHIFFCSAGNYKQLSDIQTCVIIFSTKIKNNYQVVKIFEMVKVISNLFEKNLVTYKHHLLKKIRIKTYLFIEKNF